MTLMLRQPLPLLDNDVLRTFVAIADTGSFTTAADRVYRTPSAVSMQIKKLEEQLNVTLFLRDARSVTLTEGGEVVKPGFETLKTQLTAEESEQYSGENAEIVQKIKSMIVVLIK